MQILPSRGLALIELLIICLMSTAGHLLRRFPRVQYCGSTRAACECDPSVQYCITKAYIY